MKTTSAMKSVSQIGKTCGWMAAVAALCLAWHNAGATLVIYSDNFQSDTAGGYPWQGRQPAAGWQPIEGSTGNVPWGVMDPTGTNHVYNVYRSTATDTATYLLSPTLPSAWTYEADVHWNGSLNGGDANYGIFGFRLGNNTGLPSSGTNELLTIQRSTTGGNPGIKLGLQGTWGSTNSTILLGNTSNYHLKVERPVGTSVLAVSVLDGLGGSVVLTTPTLTGLGNAKIAGLYAYGVNANFDNVLITVPVPEPSVALLLVTGGLGLFLWRRRS